MLTRACQRGFWGARLIFQPLLQQLALVLMKVRMLCRIGVAVTVSRLQRSRSC